MQNITIAVDAMGGDFGPSVTIPAVIQALKKHPSLKIILVGDLTVVQEMLHIYHYSSPRLLLQHASEKVEMNESPAFALRNKKDSSLRVALDLVKEARANGCVSAGNTGALMATARFVLKTLPGIDRPAIISTFPTQLPHKNVRLLDLGANVDCTSEHLFQFALMGSVFASEIANITNPKVFLLNIGEEAIKGNEQVKQTAERLTQTNIINYAGYIEGDSLYQGIADVVVCDGFVGNVALKTTEGVAKLMISVMRTSFQRHLWTRLLGLLVKPVLKSFLKKVDPAEYNGASFLGLNGVVIKSHGGAKTVAFTRAIEEAIDNVEKRVPDKIKVQLEKLLLRP